MYRTSLSVITRVMIYLVYMHAHSGQDVSLYRIDMTLFGDFIRSHISFYLSPGYYGDGLNAIIVFAACFLPDSSRADYHYVMENLFL